MFELQANKNILCVTAKEPIIREAGEISATKEKEGSR